VPGDLSRRLRDGGFALAGETQIMVLAGRLPTDARLPDGLGVRRAAGITGPAARRVASEAAAVLGAAFHVAATDILAAELAASLGDPRVTLYLVASEAGPLAVAKRFTAGHLSYISSVGTLPAWRGRGLATAATAAATADAMDAGSRRVHLSVHGPDPGATRLYSRLGYVRVGAPAEHYLAT
jgi:ribosomal protein S18 acetylase RimI-like enzyme